MNDRNHMPLSRYLVLLAVAAFAAVGDFFLKQGMSRVGEIHLSRAQQAVAAVFQPMVAIGIFFLIGFFACYLTALSWADLTYVLPATGIGYVFMALLARFVLQEHVSAARWMGIFLITCGVGFVAQSHARTNPDAEMHVLPESMAAHPQEHYSQDRGSMP
jgi:drug/metabolite transporter (DMT)-like permease